MLHTGEFADGAVPPNPRVGRHASSELRRLMERPQIARAAGAYDALSAVMIDRAGFDAVWASSFAIAASRGLPDISLLTMTDYLTATAHMVEACGVPVLADCDTGFGSAVNFAYTVQRFEAAGVGGVCIEDKIFPKTNSFLGDRQQMLSAEEFSHKIHVGKAAQRDPDFTIIARTEALICGESVDDALQRARRYAGSGADGILIHSKRDEPSEVVDFLAAWDLDVPVVVVPTTYYSLNVEAAERAGAAVVIYANHALRAAVAAVTDALGAIVQSGSSEPVERDIATLPHLFELQRVGDWLALDP